MADKIDFSLTSYILGVISIVMAFFSPMSGIVFGIIGLVQSKKQKTNVSKISKKLNIIGIVASSAFFVLTLLALAKVSIPSLA